MSSRKILRKIKPSSETDKVIFKFTDIDLDEQIIIKLSIIILNKINIKTSETLDMGLEAVF